MFQTTGNVTFAQHIRGSGAAAGSYYALNKIQRRIQVHLVVGSGESGATGSLVHHMTRHVLASQQQQRAWLRLSRQRTSPPERVDVRCRQFLLAWSWMCASRKGKDPSWRPSVFLCLLIANCTVGKNGANVTEVHISKQQ